MLEFALPRETERLTVTADDFRELALALPEAIESEHMGHPDFRVGKRIFASIGPDETWAMVKLKPEQQALFTRTEPEAFQPIPGGWGLRGATQVLLKSACEQGVRQALLAAWRNVAPKRLIDQLELE